ncbi:MAG: hypothetical protein H6Q90_6267 [Deltaproteobacteria bacterium]|nr:hypothetical protein [Deltaproteobacteria bacterium]
MRRILRMVRALFVVGMVGLVAIVDGESSIKLVK